MCITASVIDVARVHLCVAVVLVLLLFISLHLLAVQCAPLIEVNYSNRL